MSTIAWREAFQEELGDSGRCLNVTMNFREENDLVNVTYQLGDAGPVTESRLIPTRFVLEAIRAWARELAGT